MRTSPEQAGIFRSLIKNALVELNVAIPCEVTGVNNHLVNVQLSINRTRVQPNGERVPEQTTVLEQVRIVYPTTADGFVRVPVKAGDKGLIVFSDYDVDNWHEGNPDPNTARVHDINDGYYFPAFAPADENYDHDCTEIGYQGNNIRLCAGGIEINGDTKLDGDFEVTGDVEIEGDLDVGGETTLGGIRFSTHKHGTPNGPSGPPI